MAQPSQQVVARMARLGVEFTRAGAVSVQRAALQAKNAQQSALRQASGGDLRMSGVGAKGARVGARYVVTKTGEAMVFATGPVHLLEHPSQPHEITPKRNRRKRGRGSGPKALAMSPHPVASVKHPGVRSPKRPWAKGFVVARPIAGRTIKQQYGAAFARSMRG